MPKSHPATYAVEQFARVLDVWAEDGANDDSPAGALGSVLANYPACRRRWGATSVLKLDGAGDLLARDMWVLGRATAVDGVMVHPVATAAVRSDGDFVQAHVRVALLYNGGDGAPHAAGFRFESAERESTEVTGPPRPHLFPHLQFIEGWTQRGTCLVHPPAQRTSDIDECYDCAVAGTGPGVWPPHPWLSERPAIPLRCRTLPGLAVAALAAVYGAYKALEILETESRVYSQASPWIRDDFDWILGHAGQGQLLTAAP